MNLLVCDDDKDDLSYLVRLLTAYAQKHRTEMTVTVCNADAEIEDALSHSDKFDVMFLDICLDNRNGMDLARWVRESNRDSEIVFVSSSRDYALDAFGVGARQYLLKPADAPTLERVMDDIRLARDGGNPRCLNIRTGNRIQRLAFSDIEYAEKCRNDICFHMTGGGYYMTRMTLSDLYLQVQNEREFVLVGKSYVINLRHVCSLSGTELKTDSHVCISIPRGSYPELKTRYFDFYSLH